MRAVNLIPRDARRSGVSPALGRLGPGHLLLAVMVVVLAYVTATVLTNNTVAKHKSQLASLQQQVSQTQAEVTRLNAYAQFEQLAQTRAATVRQIASTRFDWHSALSDLSKVVPADTTLQSLNATVAPGVATGGTAGSGGGLRGDLNAPAFELTGCTGTQDEVAQLMSRLRLINGVTRVTLENSIKPAAGQSGASVSSTGSASGSCSSHGPTFSMVVFFQSVAGAASTSAGPSLPTTPGGAK